MHPMKKEGASGHNAKLRKLTRNYGAANPKMSKAAPVDDFEQSGPQEDVGFGDDAAAAVPRADRASRKPARANPVATYTKGGRIKHERTKAQRRADGGDVSSIEQANREQAIASRARGGRTKSKGTHVNVIVAPQGGQTPPGGGMTPVPPVGAMPPIPPGAPPMPPGGEGMPPLGPMAAGAPGGLPPGLIPPRKRGGKVSHSDEAEDRALVRGMVKPDALKGRANGGRIHMTAGAESGPGRMQKAETRRRNAKGERPQAV